jgi:dipeptidyl aminopeptidase/acylaminoacyl peptidase
VTTPSRGHEPRSPAALVRRQAAVDAHALAPDGRWAVYVRRTVSGTEYRRHLCRVAGAGGAARRLTRGRVLDTDPAISPDGRWIAFLRAPADPSLPAAKRSAQVWFIPAAGGAPRPIGRLPHGAESVSWSPDGSTLSIVAFGAEERFVPGRTRDGEAPTVRRMTRMDFRDESGYLDHRRHLWLAPARRGARPAPLTHGDFDVNAPSWAPDGRTIAFATDAGPDAGIYPRSILRAVTVPDGRIRDLASLPGDLESPAWSPDGRWIAAIGTEVADPPESTQPELFVVDRRTGATRSLTATLDLPVGAWASTHLSRSEEWAGPCWLDADTVVVLVTRRGRSLPWRIRLDGSSAPLVAPDTRVVARGLRVANGTVTVNAQVGGGAQELYRVAGQRLRRLSTNGGAWQRRVPLPRTDELEVPGPAGPIQLWLHSPSAADDRPLPTILDIHGGPTGSWGIGRSLDVLAFTARGWRVAQPNIRGSAGFGAAWVEALGDRWGDVDAADALAVVDGLVARGLADAGRLGVIGLSYGGFLASWLVGVTDRFAAGVTENGVSNQATAWAECYFGIYDGRRSGLGDPLSDAGATRLWERSPLRNVARIRTPLLMLQAEDDRICPASDNVQLFAALRALDRPVEYCLYPEEHHVFQSVGRPDRRIDRLERVLAWFERAFAPGAPSGG